MGWERYGMGWELDGMEAGWAVCSFVVVLWQLVLATTYTNTTPITQTNMILLWLVSLLLVPLLLVLALRRLSSTIDDGRLVPSIGWFAACCYCERLERLPVPERILKLKAMIVLGFGSGQLCASTKHAPTRQVVSQGTSNVDPCHTPKPDKDRDA